MTSIKNHINNVQRHHWSEYSIVYDRLYDQRVIDLLPPIGRQTGLSFPW